MNKRLRTIILSGAVLLVTAATAAVATYALFSDQATLTNHIEAGNLKIGLKRTNLVKKSLDNQGLLKETTNSEVVDFTKATARNLFDLGIDEKMVPQGFYEATITVENKGTVAFDYFITIKSKDSDTNALLDQLEITVTNAEGTVLNGSKSIVDNDIEIGNSITPIGQITKGSSVDGLKIKVAFKDDENNNDAMDLSVNFDMILHAVQSV